MLSASLVALLGMIGFASASFVFALAETALFTLGPWRARQLAEQHPQTGARVLRMLERPQELLSAIVLGNTCANTALVAIAVWMSLGTGEIHPVMALAGTVLLILFGCEAAPKTLAVRMPEWWALQLARPIGIFVLFATPGLRLVQGVGDWLLHRLAAGATADRTGATDEEYQELLELAFQQGELRQSEKEIILEIIGLDRQTAGDVMTPRSQMTVVPYDLAGGELLAAVREHRHTRLPMFDETPDTIVGVLNTRQLLLHPEDDIADAIEFPSFVPESMNLLTLFQSLQKQRRGMAIVLDEYGGVAGVVTIQDILEQMIGEIPGAKEDEGFTLEVLGKGHWRVGGTTSLEDFRREHPALPEHSEVDTMGGLMVALLEVVPRQGESARHAGLRLTATQVTERRVLELEVRREGRAREGSLPA